MDGGLIFGSGDAKWDDDPLIGVHPALQLTIFEPEPSSLPHWRLMPLPVPLDMQLARLAATFDAAIADLVRRRWAW
jgi:hypothetical protein